MHQAPLSGRAIKTAEGVDTRHEILADRSRSVRARKVTVPAVAQQADHAAAPDRDHRERNVGAA